jgi:ribosomal protein S7
MLRKYEMGHGRYLGLHEKTKPMNHIVEEGKKIQTKGIDNLLNKIITENIPNLKKERVTQMQEALQNTKPSVPKKETLSNTS